jgi:hypothetical protein
MAENSSSGICRRQIDAWYIVFVRTNDDDADIFTKNVNKETYEKHVLKLLGKRKYD